MVTILYKTDFHHSFNSREVLGIYTNKQKLFKDCKEIITLDIQSDSGQMDKEEEKQQIDYQVGFLFDKKQTQGLNNFELVIEEENKNSYDKKSIQSLTGYSVS